MILSGLRVFDIRDPRNPREIAYFNAPVTPRIVPAAGIDPPPSNWAMSSPSFVPERGEIWYSDGLSGFYAVRLTGSAGSARLPARAPAWRGARRSARATSAVSGSGTPAAGCCACPWRRSGGLRRSYRYCVKGSHAGRVSAVFSRRGRVALVTTTAGVHGNRRLRPGSSLRALRRAYPRRRALGRGLYRANGRSPRLIGFRGGRVRFFAVVDRSLLRNRRALRRHLRLAGL